MKKHFLFIVFMCTCLLSKAQYEGEWYVLRTKGLTGFFFEKDQMVTIEYMDSIGGRPKRIVDTTYIKHRIEKNGFVYLIGETNYQAPKFMKTKKVSKNCFVNHQLIIPQNTHVQFNGEADLLAYVDHDTLPSLGVTVYSRDSITKATYLRPLGVATAYEFSHLLDVLIAKFDAVRAFAYKYLEGGTASLLYLMPIVKGDIERGSYIQENFSPFSSKKDFQLLSEKYGTDAEIAKKLEKLKKG